MLPASVRQVSAKEIKANSIRGIKKIKPTHKIPT
jgi:hypothetical protein